MQLDELHRRLIKICPDGEIGEDKDGQIIFYTNLGVDSSGEAVDLLPDDKEEPK